MRHIILVLATWFGAGFSPVAPGTAGTLAAVPLFCLWMVLPPLIYGVSLAAFAFLACWVSGRAEEILRGKDSSRIVIDEVVGFLVTMAYVPATWMHLLLGFVLFRVFDVAKPFPIRTLERHVPGGWGVVVDDVLAGIYAQAALRLLTSVVGLLP